MENTFSYEQAYKNALERARKVHRNYKNLFPEDSYSEDIEEIFPELRESEDERIRKWIIKVIEQEGFRYLDETYDQENALAWLEKQKEEKHATIEQVYEKFLSSDTLKSAKENKYIRAQLLWELMHNGIITEADYQYLTYDKRKPWTSEEYRIAY